MERIRYYADISIKRGCGFGLLAIATAVVGMGHDMKLALKAAAIMVTLMGVILLIKAARAPRRNYRNTEVWLLMGKKHDLPEERAQAAFAAVLREVYLKHADIAAGAALVLWIAGLLLWLAS
jgi:hypothetical protein